MNRRDALNRFALAAAALVVANTAFAESDNWPSRPITMIVPAAAGSGLDILGREVAARLSVALKQSVIVDNKPGGSGIVGTQAVVHAQPNGYTLLYTNASFAVMAPALVRMPYDIQRDLIPVAQSIVGGVMLSVSPDFPAKNLQELVQQVKANPGKYSYGTWAVGSTGHLIMEWLKRRTGMEITHVPYRQVNQLMTELSAGVLKIGWTDSAAPISLIEAGKIRPIAVSGPVHLPRTPKVPTMGEQGWAFDSVGWYGFFVVKGTPKPIVQRLSDEINRIHALPEVIARMKVLNVSPPLAKTPEQFRSVVDTDMRMWKQIVTDEGITTEN